MVWGLFSNRGYASAQGASITLGHECSLRPGKSRGNENYAHYHESSGRGILWKYWPMQIFSLLFPQAKVQIYNNDRSCIVFLSEMHRHFSTTVWCIISCDISIHLLSGAFFLNLYEIFWMTNCLFDGPMRSSHVGYVNWMLLHFKLQSLTCWRTAVHTWIIIWKFHILNGTSYV